MNSSKDQPLVYGISGLARSGKDTVSKILCSMFTLDTGRIVEVIAFANPLKQELEQFIRTKYNLSVWSDKTEEKNIFRPDLVQYSKEQKVIRGKDVWLNKVRDIIDKNISERKITIVSDIRYKIEAELIKSYGGPVLYVNRILEDGSTILPSSDHEADNMEEVKSLVDLTIDWPTTDSYSKMKEIALDIYLKLKYAY